MIRAVPLNTGNEVHHPDNQYSQHDCQRANGGVDDAGAFLLGLPAMCNDLLAGCRILVEQIRQVRKLYENHYIVKREQMQ